MQRTLKRKEKEKKNILDKQPNAGPSVAGC